MFDSDLNDRSVQEAEGRDLIAGSGFTIATQLASLVASALQDSGRSVTILQEQEDTASRQ
jgi:hypothetical protein